MKIKECSEPHLGSYDMRMDTTGMPESLATKLNSHICNKGGAQSSVATQGVPKEFMPYLQKGLDIAGGRLGSMFETDDSGAFTGKFKEDAFGETVADFTEEQKLGQQAGTDLARQAITGTGIYDTSKQAQDMLANLQGNIVGQRLGGLGSARGDRAMQAALLDKGMEIATQRQDLAQQGAEALQDIGATKQMQEQIRLDAPQEELGFYSQFVSGNVPKQTTTTSSGGGK